MKASLFDRPRFMHDDSTVKLPTRGAGQEG